MDSVSRRFGYSDLKFVGLDDMMSPDERKRNQIFNRILSITILTYISFLPIAGIMESFVYLLILIFSASYFVWLFYLNSIRWFRVSKTLFYPGICFSLSAISVHVGIDSGVHLGLIPISILPLLYIQNKVETFVSFVLAVVLCIVVEAGTFSLFPIEVSLWKTQMLYYSIAVGIVVVGFMYNAMFKLIVEESETNLIEVNNKIDRQNASITENISLAREIQSNLLPELKKFKSVFPQSLIFYRARDLVSGDFYWMDDIDGKKYCAVIDCTGHGVPGAFMSIIGHQALNQCIHVLGLRKPADILNKLHELVFKMMRKEDSNMIDGMDMSLVMIDEQQGQFIICGATNSVLLIRQNAHRTEQFEPEYKGIDYDLYKIPAQRQSIGSEFIKEPFKELEFEIKSGDSLYMYSDGYIDQFGGSHTKKMFHQPFRKLILGLQNYTMQEQEKKIIEHFDRWKGEHMQVDDVCVVGIKIKDT